MRYIFLILVWSLLVSGSGWASDTKAENAVWTLEQAYWKYVKSNDVKSYSALWDDNFIGWPSDSKEPMTKVNVGDWIPGLHKDPAEHYDYELTLKAVRCFGEVVVVHYLARDFYRSARTDEIVRPLGQYRITHTWHRRGESWQIITGMAADQPN